MTRLTSTILVLALTLTAFAVSPAQAEEILLNTGSGIEGTIQSVDQTSMTVKTKDGETVELMRGAVDPHFYYTAWSKRMEQTAENHLRVAVFTFENGLFNQARSQYRKAQSKDKELVKKFEAEIVPDIKEGIAQKLLGMARAAVEANEYRKAETIAVKLLTRLEDTKAAEEARTLIASVHTWELDNDQERLIKRLTSKLPKDEKKALRTRTRISDRAGPIEKHIKDARAMVTKALGEKSQNRQKGIFEQAAKKFEAQVRAVDKLLKDATEDEALTHYLQGLREIAVREGVDAWLAAGNVNVSRRSFPAAIKQGEKALALDPDSAKAKKFVAEATEASRYNNGWFNTVARGGRPGTGGRGGGGRRR